MPHLVLNSETSSAVCSPRTAEKREKEKVERSLKMILKSQTLKMDIRQKKGNPSGGGSNEHSSRAVQFGMAPAPIKASGRNCAAHI